MRERFYEEDDRRISRQLDRDFEREHGRRQQIPLVDYAAVDALHERAPVADASLGDCHDPDCDHCRAAREYGTRWSAYSCINLGRRVAVEQPEQSWRPSDRSAL